MLKNNKKPERDVQIGDRAPNKSAGRIPNIHNPAGSNNNKMYSFNQSELMKTIDDTIDLKLTMSFQNSEITGRSTMCDELPAPSSNNRPLSPSIENILATSCSADIRNILSSTKQEQTFLQMEDPLNGKDKNYWDITNLGGQEMSFKSTSVVDHGNYNEFKSLRLVEPNLLADELEWKKQFAVIPTDASEESKSQSSNSNISKFDSQRISESQFNDCFNSSVSISTYFNKKSEDLHKMLPQLSPKKKMMPAPLHILKSEDKENHQAKNSLENIDFYLAQFDLNDSPNAIIQKLVNKHGSKRNETLASLNSNKNYQHTRTIMGSLNTSKAFSDDGLVSDDIDQANSKENESLPSDVNLSSATGVSELAERNERILASENLNEIDDYNENTPGLLKPQNTSPLWLNPGPSDFLPPNTIHQKYSLPIFGSNYNHVRSNSQSPTSQKSNFGSQRDMVSNGRDFGFPLKSSKSEIAWGSVKLRQRAESSIKLKNITNKKVTLKLYISGPGFQFGSVDNNSIITLQRQECSTFSIAFCPTIVGSAVGNITIQVIHVDHTNNMRVIPLYGYGGHAILHVDGVQLGPIGPQGLKFLPLGDFRHLTQPIKKHFRLINRGTLPAFVIIDVKTKMRDLFMGSSSIQVNPQKFIIDSNASREISLVFNPRCDEIKKFLKNNSDVLPIANLSILYGDEPTRHRIKRLIKKASVNEQKNVHKTLNDICTKFVRESAVGDIQMLRESWGVLSNLIDNFHTEEIEVTLNRNMDETLMNFTLDIEDESLMFRTIIASPLNEEGKRYCQPGEYEIDPSYEQIGNVSVIRELTIKNVSFEKIKFMIVSDAKYIFGIEPHEGFIRPDNQVCIQFVIDNDDFNFNLYKTEDDCNFVSVTIAGKNISIPTCLQNV